MIITIDGPAGAGKSTVARELASRLGFHFLDTGAMYRAIAWLSLQQNLVPSDPKFSELLEAVEIRIQGRKIWVNQVDVSDSIRSEQVNDQVSLIADDVAVRQRLTDQQRKIAANGNYVCEGRDQGTVVFPDSPCKIFLTASPEERAKRRANEINKDGASVTVLEILKQQTERDKNDESRTVGRLVKASDATEIITDGMELDKVIDEVERIVRQKLNLPKSQ